MEADRLSTGEKISAVSAVLLFIFMFFDWFGAKVEGVTGFSGDVPGGGSAWDALDIIPIFLMAAIVVAIGVAVIRLTDADIEPPISLNTIVAVLGGLAFLLILYRIIDPPSAGGAEGFGVSVDITRKLGIFLGLAAAAGIAYGGFSAMREEGVTFGDAADRLSGGGPGAGQPPAGGPPQHQAPGQQPPPPPAPGQQPPPPPPQQPRPPGS
jgi:hypothetical protein